MQLRIGNYSCPYLHNKFENGGGVVIVIITISTIGITVGTSIIINNMTVVKFYY